MTFGDARDYMAHARALCETGAYPERGNLPFFRAPLLPLFIAAVTGCSGSVAAVKISLAIVDALTCVIVASLARTIWTSARAAAIAGIAAAANPFFVVATTDVRSEPLFMLLLSGAIWSALRAGSRAAGAIAGVLIALAALTRPAALALIPLGAAFVFIATHRSRRQRMLLFAGAVLVALLPWSVRNAVRYDALILVNDAGGYNLWRGTHPQLESLMRERSPEERRLGAIEFEAAGARLAREIEQRWSTHGERQAAWRRLAIEEVRANPRAAFRFAALKAWMFWRPWLDPAEHSRVAVLVSGALNLLLYIAAAAGLVLLWRREQKVAAVIVAMFLVAWLIHVPYQTVMRFRIPITDPLMIVLAAGAVTGRNGGAERTG